MAAESTVTTSHFQSVPQLLEGMSEVTLFDHAIAACIARPETLPQGCYFSWAFREDCPIANMMLALCSVLERHAAAAVEARNTAGLIVIQRMQCLLRGQELSDSVWESTRWFVATNGYHLQSSVLSLRGGLCEPHTVSLVLTTGIARTRMANLQPDLRVFLQEVAEECYGICKDPARKALAESRWIGRK